MVLLFKWNIFGNTFRRVLQWKLTLRLTCSYDYHFIIMTTFFRPKCKFTVGVCLLFWRPVDVTTSSLLRPGFYGPMVVTVFAFQYFTKWLWMRRCCRILVLATFTFIIFGCFHMKSRKVCNKTMSPPAFLPAFKGDILWHFDFSTK